MKFERGDEIYQGLVEAAGHELLVATENQRMFKISSQSLKNSKESRLISAMCYQYYAEFIRSLYEYYVAIIQWNEESTNLRKYDFDSKMTEAVQRLLNFYGPIRKPLDPSFPDIAPIEFGKHFRQVRNRVSHADYRRMAPHLGNSEITLAKFYESYNFYCELLLEHPQFTWGGNHFIESYKWQPVIEFVQVVTGSDL